MNEYVKELLDLKVDIEKRTNEAINKIEPTKFELLDKAIEKIHSHYDLLLDSIDGNSFTTTIKLDDTDYKLFLVSNTSNHDTDYKNSRYAYIKETNYHDDGDSYILNARTYEVRSRYGFHPKKLRSNDDVYSVGIIKLVTKYHDEIQEKIKSRIEEVVTERNLKNLKKVSNEAELINTLDNFLK